MPDGHVDSQWFSAANQRQSGIARANSSNVKLQTWSFTHLTSLHVQKNILTLRGTSALDTVPHWAIKPYLARNPGVQGSMISVVNEMYKEMDIAMCKTKIKTENNVGVEI